MGTMIVGLAVVAVSAVVFAVSMFGRRPSPQPAMAAPIAVPAAVTVSRDRVRRRRRRSGPRTAPPAAPADLDLPPLQVEIPSNVRMRSVFLLGLGVITAAAVLGVVLSIVLVGGFTLIG